MYALIDFYYNVLHRYTLHDVETFRKAGMITEEEFNKITAPVTIGEADA